MLTAVLQVICFAGAIIDVESGDACSRCAVAAIAAKSNAVELYRGIAYRPVRSAVIQRVEFAGLIMLVIVVLAFGDGAFAILARDDTGVIDHRRIAFDVACTAVVIAGFDVDTPRCALMFAIVTRLLALSGRCAANLIVHRTIIAVFTTVLICIDFARHIDAQHFLIIEVIAFFACAGDAIVDITPVALGSGKPARHHTAVVVEPAAFIDAVYRAAVIIAIPVIIGFAFGHLTFRIIVANDVSLTFFLFANMTVFFAILDCIRFAELRSLFIPVIVIAAFTIRDLAFSKRTAAAALPSGHLGAIDTAACIYGIRHTVVTIYVITRITMAHLRRLAIEIHRVFFMQAHHGTGTKAVFKCAVKQLCAFVGIATAIEFCKTIIAMA